LAQRAVPDNARPGFSCPHAFVCQEAAQILANFAGARSIKGMESRKWGQKDKHLLTAEGDLTAWLRATLGRDPGACVFRSTLTVPDSGIPDLMANNWYAQDSRIPSAIYRNG
jgi:hypothetical protein